MDKVKNLAIHAFLRQVFLSRFLDCNHALRLIEGIQSLNKPAIVDEMRKLRKKNWEVAKQPLNTLIIEMLFSKLKSWEELVGPLEAFEKHEFMTYHGLEESLPGGRAPKP